MRKFGGLGFTYGLKHFKTENALPKGFLGISFLS